MPFEMDPRIAARLLEIIQAVLGQPRDGTMIARIGEQQGIRLVDDGNQPRARLALAAVRRAVMRQGNQIGVTEQSCQRALRRRGGKRERQRGSGG